MKMRGVMRSFDGSMVVVVDDREEGDFREERQENE